MLLLGYLFFFGKELSAVFGQTVSGKDCYNSNNNGSTYRGTVTETETKEPCLNWKVVNSRFVLYHENNNFCRNPNGFEKPWCYTRASDFEFGFCNIPVCVSVVSCSDLHLSSHMKFPTKFTGYHYPESVDFQCEIGYKVNGANHIECLSSGMWSHQPPTCRAVPCPDIMSSINMKMPSKLTGYHYPDSVDFQCEIGYQVNGANHIECLSSGMWSQQQPTCQAVSCSDLPSSSDMKMPTKLTGYHYPESVDFQCEIGYEVNGSKHIECLSSGMWSHQQPICQGMKCPQFKNVSNIQQAILLTEYRFPENAAFQCKTGYKIEGTRHLSCLENGTWDKEQPTCAAVSCPDLPSSSYMKMPIKLIVYHYPESVDFQCETGYQVNGANHIECLSSGNWSHQPPTCQEKSQSHKDSMENRGKCVSYGLFGGILAAIVLISTGIHIATCFYYRKKVGKSAAVYEDMQFNAVERQRSSNEETYSELT